MTSGASLHFPYLPSHFSTSVFHFPVASSHCHLNILQLGFLSLLPYFLTNLPFTFFCANFLHFFFLHLLNHKSSDSKITSCATQKISRPNWPLINTLHCCFFPFLKHISCHHSLLAFLFSPGYSHESPFVHIFSFLHNFVALRPYVLHILYWTVSSTLMAWIICWPPNLYLKPRPLSWTKTRN